MKISRSYIFLIFVYCFFTFSVVAQDFLVTKKWIGEKDGLNGTNLQVVYQDHNKFLWTVSPNVIYRYDGEKFEYFRTDTIDRVGELIINQIVEDANGVLWFSENYLNPYAYSKGYNIREIILLDPATKQLKSFSAYFPDAPFLKEEISTIHQDADRSLWFGLKKGAVWKYNGTFTKFYETESNSPIFAISTTALRQALFISMQGCILKLNTKGELQEKIKTEGAVRKHWVDQENRLWIEGVQLNKNQLVQNDPILIFRDHTGEFISFFDLIPEEYKWLQKRRVNVRVAPNGYLWLNPPEGIMIFDQTGKLILDLRPFFGQKDNSEQLKVDLVKEDLAWLLSSEKESRGLVSLSIQQNPFHRLLSNGTTDFSVRGITNLENGNLLVLTYQGVFELTLDSLFQKEIAEPISYKQFYGFGLSKDSQNIYLGKHGKELHVHDHQGRLSFIVDSIASNNDKVAIGDFLVPFVDKNNQLWIGTDQGLLFLDAVHSVIRRPLFQSAFPAINEARIYHFFENEQGIWIATSNGLFLMNAEGEIIAHHTHLPATRLSHIYEDQEQAFWIGTVNEGLIYWDKSRDSIKHFTKIDGLSDLTIHAILEDDFGFLWMPSNNGLMRYGKEKGVFESYFEEDGLTQNEFNQCSFYRRSDGQMFFGGINGITTFHPRDFLTETYDQNSTPVLTEVEAFNTQTGTFENYAVRFYADAVLEYTDEIKAFKVDFAYLDYGHSLPSRYLYRIKGLEEKWNEAKESMIHIGQLPYGNYQLEIKAMQKSGQWSLPLSIILKHPKPYFLQYWFLGLMTILTILLVFGLIRYRTYRLQARANELSVQVIQRTQTIESQKKELAQANEFKDKLFSLIAHDLQTPIEGLGNMSKRLNFLLEQERYDDLKKLGVVMSASSRNISKLITNLLDWTLIQKNQFYVSPKSLFLDAAISETLNLYQAIIKHKEITFTKSLSSPLRVFVDEQILKTILRNIFDNAVKYTPEHGQINLHCTVGNSYVELILENSGRSIATDIIKILDADYQVKDKALPGMGLRLCKRMADLSNGQFFIKAKTAHLTEVRLILPQRNQPISHVEQT